MIDYSLQYCPFAVPQHTRYCLLQEKELPRVISLSYGIWASLLRAQQKQPENRLREKARPASGLSASEASECEALKHAAAQGG